MGREVPGGRVSFGETMTYLVMGLGMLAMFVGMSMETPEQAISKAGAVISLLGIAAVVLACIHAERWFNV